MGHNVIVFQVLDHDELTFPYDQSTLVHRIGIDDEVVVEPGRLRQEYLDAAWRNDRPLPGEFGKCSERIALVDTSESVGAILASYLASRSLAQV